MKLRRTLSVFLAAALCAASLPAPDISGATYVNIDESSDGYEKPGKDMADKAAADVLTRITVPKEYKNYSYDGFIKDGTAYYEFTWSKKDFPVITVDYYNGFIYAYNHYSSRSNKPTFAKMSLADQEKCALEHIYKLNPDIKGDIVLERESPDYSLDRDVEYSIYRQAQGIDVSYNEGTICIDRESGELIDFTLDWWINADFPDVSGMLTEEEACSLYASKKPLTAKYKLYYDVDFDSQRRARTFHTYALPIYESDVKEENCIDAFTGNYTARYEDEEKFSSTTPYNWRGYWFNMCAGGGPYDDIDNPNDFFESEKEDFEQSKNAQAQLTDEEALKIIKAEELIKFDSCLGQNNSEYRYSRDENTNVRQLLRLEYEYSPDTDDGIFLVVYLDAYTGEIVKFYKSYDRDDLDNSGSPEAARKPLEEKAAVSAAKKAASHFIGSRAAEYRYDGNLSSEEYYISERERTGNSRVKFTRYINGLPAPFDTMTVKISPDGEILTFEYDYRNVDITRGHMLTQKEAYEKLFEKESPSLYFTGFTDPEQKSHVYLTYKFEEYYYIDAVTGERLTDEGMPYYQEETPYERPGLYTDIKGHKYESEITALYKYGVRLGEEEKLRPDDPITIDEFTELCRITGAANLWSSDVYDWVKVTDPDTGESHSCTNPLVKQPLTRGELARLFVVYYQDYKHSPDPNANYKQPYKNITRDNPNYGYIAIAKKKGYIADGKEFDSEKPLTRAECMKYIYDYIESDSDSKPLYEIIKI